jgi:hypothetical protein
MLVDAIIVTTGAAVLLPLTFGGLIAAHGRRSEELLVAPRGARFGDATRLTRTVPETANPTPLVAVRTDAPFTRSERRAA